jgi:putative tricarboxylic transport membrane protein
MKVNDAIWGAVLMLLSVVLLVHVQSFPRIPGQQYGPALFPGVIAVGLALCAALLIVKGIAARKHGHERAEWIAFEPWTRSHRHLLAFALTLGVNVFYIVAVDGLGFIPTGIVYLAVLFAVFGVRTRWILPLAVVSTLVIHTAFYKLLRVPLPWGLLEPVLW